MADGHAADEKALNAAVGAGEGEHDAMPTPGELRRGRPMIAEEWATARHGGAMARHIKMRDMRARLVLGGEASRHVEASDRRQDGAVEPVAEVASAVDDVEKRDVSKRRAECEGIDLRHPWHGPSGREPRPVSEEKR